LTNREVADLGSPYRFARVAAALGLGGYLDLEPRPPSLKVITLSKMKEKTAATCLQVTPPSRKADHTFA
jgi:hypothetical protein